MIKKLMDIFNINEKQGLHLIFECTLKNNSIPRLPQFPDPHQSGVKWIPLEELDSILLIPNINQQIKNYIKNKRNIELIEDYRLDRLRLERSNS